MNIDDIKTYDDYYAMLKAFHDGDPDGNGQNGDTYGVVAPGFIGTDAPYINYLPEFWQDAYPSILQGEDGVWYDGFQTEETKAALARLRQGYVDGCIDPESLTAQTKTALPRVLTSERPRHRMSKASERHHRPSLFRTVRQTLPDCARDHRNQ